MITRHIVETVKEYGENGLLVSERTTETDETDDDYMKYEHVSKPVIPYIPAISPGTEYKQTCTNNEENLSNSRGE